MKASAPATSGPAAVRARSLLSGFPPDTAGLRLPAPADTPPPPHNAPRTAPAQSRPSPPLWAHRYAPLRAQETLRPPWSCQSPAPPSRRRAGVHQLTLSLSRSGGARVPLHDRPDELSVGNPSLL